MDASMDADWMPCHKNDVAKETRKPNKLVGLRKYKEMNALPVTRLHFHYYLNRTFPDNTDAIATVSKLLTKSQQLQKPKAAITSHAVTNRCHQG